MSCARLRAPAGRSSGRAAPASASARKMRRLRRVDRARSAGAYCDRRPRPTPGTHNQKSLRVTAGACIFNSPHVCGGGHVDSTNDVHPHKASRPTGYVATFSCDYSVADVFARRTNFRRQDSHGAAARAAAAVANRAADQLRPQSPFAQSSCREANAFCDRASRLACSEALWGIGSTSAFFAAQRGLWCPCRSGIHIFNCAPGPRLVPSSTSISDRVSSCCHCSQERSESPSLAPISASRCFVRSVDL